MVKLTRKQREALFRVFQRDYPERTSPFRRELGIHRCPCCGHAYAITTERVSSRPYRAFRRQVSRLPDGSGCVMVPWKSMYLGIETDGYTHS